MTFATLIQRLTDYLNLGKIASLTPSGVLMAVAFIVWVESPSAIPQLLAPAR